MAASSKGSSSSTFSHSNWRFIIILEITGVRFRGSSTLRILQIRNIHCERSTTGLAGRKTSQELWRVGAVWRHLFHLIPICQHHLVFRRCLLFQLRSKIYPLLSIYRLGVNNPLWAILILSEISLIIPLVAAAPCI